MSTQPKSEDAPSSQAAADDQKEGSPAAAFKRLGGRIMEQYRKTKENAETYPYVWGSYILVYGTLGLWLTYRWRALRKMEDSVRALQEQIRKQVEAEELAAKAEELAAKSSNQSVKSTSSAKEDLAHVGTIQADILKQVEAEVLAAKSSNQSVKSTSSAKKDLAQPD